jgi:hypothetical protein
MDNDILGFAISGIRDGVGVRRGPEHDYIAL